MPILPILFLSVLGGHQNLDDFRYPTATEARAAWTSADATPPVEVVQEDGRTVMQLVAPFASQPKLRRAVVDRRISLDLAAPAGFVLEANVDAPTAVGGLTLYFHSGNGWYSSDRPIAKTGWQTLRFPKSAFKNEGTPSGWAKIDAIRLSAWRPQEKVTDNTGVRFRRLAATWHDVAIVAPLHMESPTQADVVVGQFMAQNAANLLDALGLQGDLIDEETVAAGALGQRRLVILPSGQMPSKRCTDALVAFVASGGKVVAFSVLPKKLRKAMELSDALPGAPTDRNVRPSDAESPHDLRSRSPVVQRSERGAFVNGPLPLNDRDGRKQLAAVLGELEPSLWKIMAKTELARAGKIGHCQTFDDFLKMAEGHAPAVGPYLTRADRFWRRAKDLAGQGAFSEATAMAQAAHDAAIRAYLMAAPSLAREGRAAWNHSGTGPFPGDWDRSAKLLADNGFNMVMPNMLWAGLAHYPSDVLPRSAVYERFGDQLEQCCSAAKTHHIEVHVWKVNFNLSMAPKAFVDDLRRQGRTQVSAKGDSIDWLCPSNPENRKLELDSLIEVARNYPIDGLHLDYVRYPGREYCYCDGCRRRFEADSGRPVADWPADCYSGERKNEYNDWRCRQITSLVAEIRREVQKVRPDVKLSAAVFGSYPACRDSVAQDWPAWVKAGDLDFVCPMNYTASDEEFTSLVRHQAKLIDGRIPLYPGIGATAAGVTLAADRVVGQILLARSLNADGFSIFNLEPTTINTLIPSLGLGIG